MRNQFHSHLLMCWDCFSRMEIGIHCQRNPISHSLEFWFLSFTLYCYSPPFLSFFHSYSPPPFLSFFHSYSHASNVTLIVNSVDTSFCGKIQKLRQIFRAEIGCLLKKALRIFLAKSFTKIGLIRFERIPCGMCWTGFEMIWSPTRSIELGSITEQSKTQK